MQEEKYLIIPNKKDLKLYEKYNFNTFILPLKDYSIGFNIYYDIDEINELSKEYKIYVIINKLLHRKIDDFKKIYNLFNKNIMFIVEDIGLTNIIDKDRFIMFENHIVSNYKSVNYFKDLGYKNIVINNDLTINEIKEIINKTDSNLYYFYINKNQLMYSRRPLVSDFNEYYNLDNVNSYKLTEIISKKILDIKEEKDGTIVTYDKIFCASKYINDLKELYKIINFTDIDEINENMILENYNKDNLCNLIDSDYYFIENDIKYKVGDL